MGLLRILNGSQRWAAGASARMRTSDRLAGEDFTQRERLGRMMWLLWG